MFALFFAAVAYAAVDVNTATQAELESVKGIGPAISQKILDERKKGNFKDWPDLVNRVKGIGDKNGAKFSTGGLTVNGSAFAGAPAAPAAMPAKKEATKAAAPAATASAAAVMPAAQAASTAAEKKAAAKQAKEDKKAEKAAKAASGAAMTTTSKASQPQTK
jgi:competence protein ComEA